MIPYQQDKPINRNEQLPLANKSSPFDRNTHEFRLVCWLVLICFTNANFIPAHGTGEDFLSPHSQTARPPLKGTHPIPFGNTTDIIVVSSKDFQEIKQQINEDYYGASLNSEQGEYSDFLTVHTHGQTTVYIAPISGIPIDRDSVWGQRKEINRYLLRETSGANIVTEERERLLLKIATRCNMIKLGGDANLDDILKEFFVNSQQKFESVTSAILTGELEYSFEGFSPNSHDYSHIEHFSWIYAMETLLLKSLLSNQSQGDISVLDLGAGFGHFIFTSHHLLNEEQRKRTYYVAADHKLKDLTHGIQWNFNQDNGIKNFTWQIDDLDNAGYASRLVDFNNGKPYDLIVVNHVLEHLNAKTMHEYIMEWLSATQKTLVVTVPLNDSLAVTTSSHVQEFSAESMVELAKEIEQLTQGTTKANTDFAAGGMLIFQKVRTQDNVFLEVVPRSISLFGLATVNDIIRIYHTIWGRDAYRMRGEQIEGKRLSPIEILATLNKIAEDEEGRKIAAELAESLRYTQGMTDSNNIMRPISPTMIHDIANQWKKNKALILRNGQSKQPDDHSLALFCELWAEWSTYLDFIENAQETSGRSDVDSFEGVREERLSDRVHLEYEKADLLGLKVVYSLMRVPFKEIKEKLVNGEWDSMIKWAVLAILYGEGKIYQSLKVFIAECTDPTINQDFWNLVGAYVDELQADYRTRHPMSRIDFVKLSVLTNRFLSEADRVEFPAEFDFDEAWLKARQRKMRLAEFHLGQIENEYANFSTRDIEIQNEDPVELYKRAMLFFLEALDHIASRKYLVEILQEYRKLLLRARKLSDRKHPHNYYFWTGFGEDLTQIKTRSYHPRYQLYQMEAYAERMFVSAQLAMEDLNEGIIDVKDIKNSYDEYFNFNEITLYTQEWIANFGPRRPVVFGYSGPVTIEENDQILSHDRWVYNTRQVLIASGGDAELWGPLSSGYTERLRYLLRDGQSEHSLVLNELETLLSHQDISGFSEAVRNVSPDDPNGKTLTEETPTVTIGVHAHNTRSAELYATMVHVRELDWPQQYRWSILGTTSSDRSIAKAEYHMALELGISRVGITNRQLLKAGNQNRSIPNTPKLANRESFYFTLDDDYIAAPLTLHRCVPLLLQEHPTSAFIQIPLMFRAAIEPGHSIGRHLDADMLHSTFATLVPGFNDENSSIPLVFGTNTLYRTTRGKNLLEATGGFVVDLRTIVAGEDIATAVMAILMNTQPDLFEQVQGRWTVGIQLPPEAWVVGDSVDFAPGGLKQKQRYSDSNTRIFKFWLSKLFKSRGIGTFHWKSLIGLNTYLISYGASALLGITTHILQPLLVMTHSFVGELSANFFFACYLVVSSFFVSVYANRSAGLTLTEVVEMGVMSYFGTFLSHLKGTLQAILLKPGNEWLTLRGRGVSKPQKFIHLGFGILHLAAVAVSGIWQGSSLWVLIPNIVSGITFFSLWRFHEAAPNSQREKILKIAQDVKQTSLKRILTRLTFPKVPLGSPIQMKSPRRIWQIWTFVTSVAFIFSFTFQGFSIIHLPLLLGYSLLLSYFWMVTRGIENRILINEQTGKVKPETLAQRIHSYSHINSANSIGGNASLEGQERRSPETEATGSNVSRKSLLFSL